MPVSRVGCPNPSCFETARSFCVSPLGLFYQWAYLNADLFALQEVPGRQPDFSTGFNKDQVGNLKGDFDQTSSLINCKIAGA